MKRHFEYVSNIEAHEINDAILLEVECSKVGGNFCDNMGVSGFPTIVLMHKGKAMKYQGGRTHGAIMQFLSDKSKWVMENLPPKIAEIAKTLAAVNPPQEKIAVATPGQEDEVEKTVAEDSNLNNEVPPVAAVVDKPVAEDSNLNNEVPPVAAVVDKTVAEDPSLNNEVPPVAAAVDKTVAEDSGSNNEVPPVAAVVSTKHEEL